MERRSLLKTLSAAAAVGAVTNLGGGRMLSAEAAGGVVKAMGNGGPLAQAQRRGPQGHAPVNNHGRQNHCDRAHPSSNWTIVKVKTSEPGLYGLGSATHQEVPQAAQAYIEKRLKPFVDRQKLRRDRRHLAICLRAGIFSLGAGRQQRAQRNRWRAVGHPGQASWRSGVPAPGRESASGSAALWSRCCLDANA